jgi:hypothetical protein
VNEKMGELGNQTSFFKSDETQQKQNGRFQTFHSSPFHLSDLQAFQLCLSQWKTQQNEAVMIT